MKKRLTLTLAAGITLAVLSVAGTPAHANKAVGQGPCTEATQCGSGLCIEINDDSNHPNELPHARLERTTPQSDELSTILRKVPVPSCPYAQREFNSSFA